MKEMFNLITKTGISVTTIATLFLFGAGFFYWAGYLGHFNLNPWMADIPFLRIIFPKQMFLTIVTQGFITFLILRWREKICMDCDARDMALVKYENYLKRYGLSESSIIAFDKSPFKEKLQTIVFANINKFVPILQKKIPDIFSLSRDELYQLQLKQNEMEIISALSDTEYKGFCWFLVKGRSEFSDHSDVEEIKIIENNMLEKTNVIERKYKIGKFEWILSISFALISIYTIYEAISTINYILLSAIILGIVSGFLVFYGIKFKSPDTKYSTLILCLILISTHCYCRGIIDAGKPLNKIGLILLSEPKLKYYDLILDNKEGVYVVDEVENGNSIYQKAKFIKNIEIKQIVFPSFKKIEK